MRVPVISQDGKPLMPTKPSRARGGVKEGKAKGFFKDLNQYCVQLLEEPSGKETQSISVGIDPGKKYSGVGVQSAKFTLWKAHLILPLETVKKLMEQRRMMRRGRRGRRTYQGGEMNSPPPCPCGLIVKFLTLRERIVRSVLTTVGDISCHHQFEPIASSNKAEVRRSRGSRGAEENKPVTCNL